jgi:hypothetical protein
VVVLANKRRTLDPDGRSEITDIVSLSDAACKIATDMMVAAEYHAVPRRAVFGMAPEDFQDEHGNPLPVWSSIMGRVWATENADASAMQFAESDLRNFHETVNALARLVVAITGLPESYLGISSQNPPSADAIRSLEARMVKRAERKQRTWGGSWEQAMRLALRVRDGDWNPDARKMEALWGDPATPTIAQKADAAVKLVETGIVPPAYAQEMIGMSATERSRIQKINTENFQRVTSLADFAAATTGPKPRPEGQ